MLPTQDDPVVAASSMLIGGPVGRHARIGASWWTPLRVVLALTLVACVLGFAQKLPCRGEWHGGSQYYHTCYSDIYALYFGLGLAEGKTPYLDHPVEYPVVIGAVMAAGAGVARAIPDTGRARRFFDVTWVLLTIAALVIGTTTLRLAGPRPWDAAMVALAPGLVLGGFVNWDLIAVALTGLGMLAWARRRLVWSGVWLGLAVATKFYPVVFFAPLLVLCLRAGRLRAFAVTLAAAVGSWLVVNVPVWRAAPDGWAEFYRFSRERGADWGSAWYWLQEVRGRPLDVGLRPGAVPDTLNTVASAAFLVLLVGIVVLALTAPSRPRLPQVMFLTLAAFLLTNKVYSPQYVVWLLPLVALARPRWREFLAWQAAEVLYFLGIWFYLLGVTEPGKGLPAGLYFLALFLRAGAVAALAGVVVRDLRRPESDVVRAGGVDDP
ncbi:MAG TPA: glycosyltransferase 87 family protein, partial [Mycobacteriales bacterium]|nr:glycosyltransferase 87 family protein [Mycobacteriales bacterium]